MDNEVTREESSRQIVFEADEFDVDSFNVKPLSKGLGFHQERERSRMPKPQSLPAQASRSLDRRSESQEMRPPHNTQKISPREMFWDQTVSQSDLGQFYQDSSSQPQHTDQTAQSSKEQALVEASFQSRFMAWLVDTSIVTALCLTLSFCFVTLAGMDVDALLKGMYLGLVELSLFGLGLFSLLYIFYFTILDMAASPGKSLLNLRVCGPHGDRPVVAQTLVRSVVSLLSLFLLGLPAILDFQSRLSESLVSKDLSDDE